MHRLLQYAGEQAIIFGNDYGFETDGKQFRFLVFEQGAWRPVPGDGPLRLREVPAPMELRLQAEGFERAGAADQRNEDDRDEDEAPPLEPDAFFFSTGEWTPFELQLHAEPTEIYYRLTADSVGRLERQRVDPDA